MKLNLLLATSLITGAAFGQFTQTNEPAIGTNATMFVLDSNATNYASVTGTGVTWDYSNTPGYLGATKNVSVVAPSSTASGSSYASSTKAIDMPGFMTTYFTSSASSRISQGFAFDGGAVAGTVKVILSPDEETLMNYPFAYSNSLTDAFSGNAVTTLGTFPTTGTVTATVDGTGTLKLNAGTTYTNVTRYKLSDQANASTPFGNIVMTRVQYEYYEASSGLPVLVHSELTINIAGSPIVQHLVLSSAAPDELLSISENNKATFGMYPNPANESVILSGLSGNENISIVDLAGKTVYSVTASNTTQTLNVADIQAGIYNVVVISSGVKTTKKLTIN
ncbi:T9SS type A sorting domain-containing protein [Fluviicola sp.]|jgi:hypothetical protein|uniref:T9SS type A sorting domain-containing protein n=1 Tax=Fluviicola sp. TaxID=1917219 RepID=UPI002823D03D|nr:T9SS type A sorting domain-containing protein [Fluviicola sp.]MDR0803165.1 T9SS type A sorting domain-containing protein [Fluviicola sp.]